MRTKSALVMSILLLFVAPLCLDSAADASDTTLNEIADKPAKKKRTLTPQEKAEKASRRACKVNICKALAGEGPPDGEITCDIVKTWREEDIEEMVGSRVSWTWGDARCESKLSLDRKMLRDAMTKRKITVALPAQTVTCRLGRKKQEEPYKVVVDLAPEVTFKNGKATDAELNWGQVDAPLAIYPLIYSGTGLDNQTNVLGPEVVKLVNHFTGKKCAEVGAKPSEAPAPDPDAEAPAGADEDEDIGPEEQKVEKSEARRTAQR